MQAIRTSKTDTLPFVKWTKRQGVRLFSSVGRKTNMQTNKMFAFWREGATEQVRDGFIKNKLAIQRSDCKFKRRKTFAVEAGAPCAAA